jgi:hypothetical protein
MTGQAPRDYSRLNKSAYPFVTDKDGDAPGPSWFVEGWERRAYDIQERDGTLLPAPPEEVLKADELLKAGIHKAPETGKKYRLAGYLVRMQGHEMRAPDLRWALHQVTDWLKNAERTVVVSPLWREVAPEEAERELDERAYRAAGYINQHRAGILTQAEAVNAARAELGIPQLGPDERPAQDERIRWYSTQARPGLSVDLDIYPRRVELSIIIMSSRPEHYLAEHVWERPLVLRASLPREYMTEVLRKADEEDLSGTGLVVPADAEGAVYRALRWYEAQVFNL